MSLQFWGMTAEGVGFAVAISILAAEFAGYTLHRVMHSGRFPALSKAHMIHHIELYGPNHSMRSTAYKNAAEDRMSLGNIGMEWVIPSGAILGLSLIAMSATHVYWKYEIIVIATLVVWPIFMFSYLHDRMHLQKFWMEKTPVGNIWFKHARRLHDIHHRSLNDAGRMDRNFGIGFFFLDGLFGTLAKRHCPVNWNGYRAAIRRHQMNFENGRKVTSITSPALSTAKTSESSSRSSQPWAFLATRNSDFRRHASGFNWKR